MDFKYRSYSGKLFVPEPVSHVSDDGELILIVTPWGDPTIADSFIESITQSLSDFEEDEDKTVVSINSATDKSKSHLIKEALVKVNKELIETFNDDEYSAGVEFICIYKQNHHLHWVQQGAPTLGLLRDEKIYPLHQPLDMSFDFSEKKPLGPLPRHLFGVESHNSFYEGRIRLKKDDHLVLVSRSYINQSFYQSVCNHADLDQLCLTLAKDNEELPFWVALLSA